eukprot:CAMPEP_0119306684 /NCGR_PEP_ID=MMETSP1333-20130426/7375_1 /TAXON_ID=418940 /ORGANISM="Scyphosphaera apsteinii, Strain RCC1455" /LENGTH=93 /DNA_ID=CAMNT_0007310045 /DNA_START=217 /DNA_END=498 /DNA_ORIENTATION=-
MATTLALPWSTSSIEITTIISAHGSTSANGKLSIKMLSLRKTTGMQLARIASKKDFRVGESAPIWRQNVDASMTRKMDRRPAGECKDTSSRSE